MMILATGCSHTYGDDLSNKLDAWPFLLADMMNSAVINLAMSGNSNTMITDQILSHTSKSNYDLVVIAWTYSDRETFWTTSDNHPVNFNIQLLHSLYGNHYYFKDFGKLLYGYWMHELRSLKHWLQQILMIQSWMKARDQHYVMLNSSYNRLQKFLSNDWMDFSFFHKMNDSQIEESRQEITRYVDLIDQSCYYGLIDYAIDDQNFETGPTGHYLKQGHQDTAERIYRFICSR
jgi:hypothetical protein